MKSFKQLLAILMTVTMIMTGTSLGGFGALSFAEDDQDNTAVSQELQDDSQTSTEAVQNDADDVIANVAEKADFDNNTGNTYSAGRLHAEVKLSDESMWQITADYTKKARIPKDAEIVLEEIDEKDTDDYLKEMAEEFKLTDENQAAFARFFNISITSNDNEIEPAADVEFTVKAKDVEMNIDTMQVVSFDADKNDKIVKIEKLECEATKNKELTFKTDECTVFGFVAFKEAETEKTDSEETAADDMDLVEKTLKAGKVKLEGLMPEDAKATATDASEVKAVRKLEGDGETTLAAYDITIKADDNEYQPDTDNPIKVEITDKAIREDSILTIWHIMDDGTKEEVTDFTVSEGKVAFEATGFSVYAVIDHEEQTVENPRVEFHFISPVENDYSPAVTNDIAYYTSTKYEFKNTHADNQTTQILKNGESMELINDPENNGDKQFYGWYIVDYSSSDENNITYSWPENPERITFGKPITIIGSNVNIGDDVNWSLNGVNRSGTVDEDGNVHVYLAPLFENYGFVNFMLYPYGQEGNELMTRKMIAFGNAQSAEVKISDVRASSNDPVHRLFIGWQYNAGTAEDPIWQKYQTVDYTGAEMNDPGKNGTYMEVNSNTPNVDLYPIFVEARWVDFVSGISGSGASYVASRFRDSWGTPDSTPVGMTENENTNIFTSFDTSTRPGYVFDGWYAFAKTDSTGEITNLDSADDVTVDYITGDSGSYTKNTVTVNTKAIKIADADGSIVYNGTCYLTDNDDGTGSISDSGNVALFGSGASGSLKLYDGVDRLTLNAKWNPGNSKITIIYWTENAQDENYAAPEAEKDDYSASAVKVVTTSELNSQSGTIGSTFSSGSTLSLTQLQSYQDNSVSVLDSTYLNDAGAVLDGEELFYDLNTTLSDASVTIKGDGSTVFNVYFERKTFKLVFHIGRDGYVKENGQQREAYMSDPRYVNWDGNWIQFMYDDEKVTNPVDDPDNPGLGYTAGPTAKSHSGVFSMAYDGKTYTSEYVTNSANVKGDYVPGDDENVYVITAKYGAYIGDRWPTPTNSNFTFTDPFGAKKTMYTWAAYYDSLYCYIAHHRSTYGNNNGNNPDINGVYNYMSKELCSNRAGTAIINAQQVHHLVAYFGDKGKTGILKTYHIMYKAIDGIYDSSQVTPVSGTGYLAYDQTTWSAANGKPEELDGYNFYEKTSAQVISNVEPQYQLGWELDGYDCVYSCYETSGENNQDVYFFYTPKEYTLTFNLGDTTKVDKYNYTQPLADADKYTDLVEVPEGYYFAGWYTNAEGVGKKFDFANETMPAQNIVLYPILRVHQYTIKIDPNGGVLDHRSNASMSTYFTADYGTRVGEYTIECDYIKLTEKELDSNDPAYYSGTKYYYINTQRLDIASEGDWGLPTELRNAVYVAEDQIDDYYDWYCGMIESADPDWWSNIQELSKEEFLKTYASYPYRPASNEHYALMGWYKVNDDGTVDQTPYNFSEPVTGPLELRAKWRLDGGYYIQYNPDFSASNEQGEITQVSGEMVQWTDPSNYSERLYSDQAKTTILRAPSDATVGWVFRGWRVVRKNGTEWEPIQLDKNGQPIYYQPGDDFIIDSSLASEYSSDGNGKIIHMQAYYEPESSTNRKPETANLILDANDEYGGYINTDDSTSLPPLAGPGSEIINTYTEPDSQDRPTQIIYGDIQSNLALHLFKYNQFFEHNDNYLLLGFDGNSDPMSPTTDKPYVPAFAADSVISVQRTDEETLYAMWEPMVYATFVNTTDEQITIVLSGSGDNTVSIINQVTGEFDREKATTTITIPAKSGNKNGEVKIALPGAAPGTDAITAIAKNDHIRKQITVEGRYGSILPYGDGSEDVKYGDDVTYTGTLVSDKDGIIITYTEEVDAQVLYNVNGGTWNDTDPYEHISGDVYAIEASDIADNDGYEPVDPTRTGKIFIGWTTNPDIAASTDFSSTEPVTYGTGESAVTITPDPGGIVLDKVRSDYLWDFSQDASLLYNTDETLYAVWSESVTVTFNLAYSSSLSANPLKLHTWKGPETTDTEGYYVFYRSSDTSPYITYTMAKGEKVVKPDDPTAHTDRPTWNFVRWLMQNTTTDEYRYRNKEPSDNNFTIYAFDFSQRVMNDTTLLTSWTTRQPQHFTFTVENNVINGNPDEEFVYTIAVSDERVVGKFEQGGSNRVDVPNQLWGSVSTTLKGGQQYTVNVTVSYITNWGGANAIEIEVVDRDGTVVKSGHVVYCIGNTYKNFVSDYKYTLTVTQEAKDNYDTTVREENETPINSIVSSTSDADRSFTFASSTWRGNSLYESDFTPTVNDYVGGENNSLDIVYTNTGTLVAPTGYTNLILPFIFMLTAGMLLGVATLYFRKRREIEE